MDLGLAGRRIVVTGGSAGIGRATVELLLAEGALVATCARQASAAADLAAHPHAARLLVVDADVRDAAAMQRFMDSAARRFGGIDGLVNNAGKGIHGSLADLDDAAWRLEVESKLFGVLHPTRAALPHLERAGDGRIVNISAVAAREPDPQMIAIGAARAAVANLGRALATELAPKGICVNTLTLGMFATSRQAARYAQSANTASFEEWGRAEARRRGVLLGRPGRPCEAARAIAFLISPAASYATGADFELSGGMRAGW
jgi:NAD(P)-dependent dehydrogenase (short-subunit alcohol dehydrogenase family)